MQSDPDMVAVFVELIRSQNAFLKIILQAESKQAIFVAVHAIMHLEAQIQSAWEVFGKYITQDDSTLRQYKANRRGFYSKSVQNLLKKVNSEMKDVFLKSLLEEILALDEGGLEAKIQAQTTIKA